MRRLAAMSNHMALMPLLIEEDGRVKISLQGEMTLLQKAAQKAYTSLVIALIEKEADINARQGEERKTALHLAAEADVYGTHFETVKVLIERGADLEVKREDGKTVLECCLGITRNSLPELLLQHGADISYLPVECLEKKLRWACTYGHLGAVQELLERGPSFDQFSKHP